MATPILIYSDPHYHDFAQFAVTEADGVNSRLGDTIRATLQAFKEVRKSVPAQMPGNAICCGDLFHVRGKIKPSVLNPVQDMFDSLRGRWDIYAISGNHDLETDQASSASSAITTLEREGLSVFSDRPQNIVAENCLIHMVPWTDLATLRKIIAAGPVSPNGYTRTALVIHAPMNGVVTGLPDHGLSVDDFKGEKWDKVFIGHYHNHKRFQVGKTEVISVGALTHQNWGDVDSLAGYCTWDPATNVVTHHETSAPKFMKVDIDDLTTAEVVDNYIKVVGGTFDKPEDIQEIKDYLLLRGAKAAVVEGVVKRPAVTRSTTSSTVAPTIHSILGEYVDRTYPGESDVKALALEILGEVYD